MAQSSRPQAGDVTANPTWVDAGPYTADLWARMYRKIYTTDQQASQGVLKNLDNELATNIVGAGAGHQVRILSGGGICNGHFFENTASVTITVDAPAGGSRTDRIVMLENNTNAAITAGPATNYNTEGNANIPPYGCRLAVVKNSPVNFTQTNALWMTPLAQITTSAAGVAGHTDQRTYCEYSTNVSTAMIDDDAVDDTKAGDRVPQFYRRQGDDATNWGTVGLPPLTDYAPTAVRMQGGVYMYTWGGGTNEAEITITFPVAFSAIPLVYATAYTISQSEHATVSVKNVNSTTVVLFLRYWGATYIAVPPLSHLTGIHWLAIGPE